MASMMPALRLLHPENPGACLHLEKAWIHRQEEGRTEGEEVKDLRVLEAS